jgi:ankyrin repeat protein
MVPKVKRRTTMKKKFKQPTAEDMFLDYVGTGRKDLVEEYLDNGGTPRVRNCKGETVLHIAAANNQNSILEILLPYFNADDLDIRDMYGLPAYITALKYGNEEGAQLISQYHKVIKTKPYRFKNYNFVQEKRIANNARLDNILNRLSESNRNPVIYPNQNNKAINILSYLPTLSNRPHLTTSPVYNNRNTKKLIIHNKKKSTKKKPSYYISRLNKNLKL